jgi:HD-like signal output (HDOD) protein
MMNSAEFYKKLDRIQDLPTLPSIVFEVNRMIQDPSTPVSRLSHVIETDQAMVMKILKLVNSSFYGFLSTISDINSAIVILGLNTIQHAVVSLSLIDAFTLKRELKNFNISDFWHHSVALPVKPLQTKRTGSFLPTALSPGCCMISAN